MSRGWLCLATCRTRKDTSRTARLRNCPRSSHRYEARAPLPRSRGVSSCCTKTPHLPPPSKVARPDKGPQRREVLDHPSYSQDLSPRVRPVTTALNGRRFRRQGRDVAAAAQAREFVAERIQSYACLSAHGTVFNSLHASAITIPKRVSFEHASYMPFSTEGHYFCGKMFAPGLCFRELLNNTPLFADVL
jgi:hypothetical protein